MKPNPSITPGAVSVEVKDEKGVLKAEEYHPSPSGEV